MGEVPLYLHTCQSRRIASPAFGRLPSHSVEFEGSDPRKSAGFVTKFAPHKILKFIA